MTVRFFICRFACLALSLVVLGGPLLSDLHAAEAQRPPVAQKPPTAKKQPAARAKVQPRPSTSHLTTIESSGPRKPAATTVAAASTKNTAARQQSCASTNAPTQANDKLKISLDTFAKDCIVRMNRQRRPGLSHKEVKRQSDGTYIARYVAVDPESLETSYNPTKGYKTIPYIGRMDYHEVEYVSVGKSQKQALAGPFNEANRVPLMELIKYKNGKWTY